MSKTARARYGVDAPIAVRNLLIVSALGIISLITRAAGLGGENSSFALQGRCSALRNYNITQQVDVTWNP